MVLNFCDLSQTANRRIANAIESAEEIRLGDFFVACQRFTGIRQRAREGKATREELRTAFQAATRAIVDARAKAALSIIDAVAREYLEITTDHQQYIDRLHLRVLTAIAEILPEPSISRSLQARITHWENQGPPKPSGRLSRPGRRGRIGIRPRLKIEALEQLALGTKKSYADCASILYEVTRPSSGQRRSASRILKHFQSTRDCPEHLKLFALGACGKKA
jgi:hypothetical protein